MVEFKLAKMISNFTPNLQRTFANFCKKITRTYLIVNVGKVNTELQCDSNFAKILSKLILTNEMGDLCVRILFQAFKGCFSTFCIILLFFPYGCDL